MCLQLCGQNSLCSGQPDHAAAHAHWHGGLYAGHRRQRHCGHYPGRGGRGQGEPLFQSVCPDGVPCWRGTLGAGPVHPPPGGDPDGCQGRDAGFRRPVWPGADGQRAHLYFTEHVPEFLCHGGKTDTGVLVHGGCRLHQHGAGRRAGGLAPLERGGRCHCNVHQPDRGRRAAGVLFPGP